VWVRPDQLVLNEKEEYLPSIKCKTKFAVNRKEFVVFPFGFHDKYCVKIKFALNKMKIDIIIVSLIHPPPPS
jgi:hypothetical protein